MENDKIEVEEISIGPAEPRTKTYPDAFDIDGADILKLRGLGTSFKRRVRNATKQNERTIDEDGFEKGGFTGLARTKSKAKEYASYSIYDAFAVVPPEHNLEYLAALYEVNPTHMGAVDAKTANIVGLGYDFVESPKTQLAMDSASPQELDRMRRNIASARLTMFQYFDSLNSIDSFQEVMKQVWIDYEATGNAYIEIGRTASGEIGYLGHVASPTMRVRRERDGFVQIIGNYVTYFRNFGDQKTKNPIGDDNNPNEIIHIKKYTPKNQFYGAPAIISAVGAIAGDEFADRYNLDYFEYKAVPRYVIISRGLTLGSDAERKLHEFFLTNLKGKNHRSIYIPVPPVQGDIKVDFEIKPIEAGKQDASWLDYHASNTIDILTAHRVPPTKLGQLQGDLAAARDADKGFKEQVTRPEQEKLEYWINKVVHAKTDIFDFHLNEVTLTDEETNAKIANLLLVSQAAVPNEVRAKFLGMGPREGGDEPVNLKAQPAADVVNQVAGIDTRGQQRNANASDSAGNGRNAKGDGRQSQ